MNPLLLYPGTLRPQTLLDVRRSSSHTHHSTSRSYPILPTPTLQIVVSVPTAQWQSYVHFAAIKNNAVELSSRGKNSRTTVKQGRLLSTNPSNSLTRSDYVSTMLCALSEFRGPWHWTVISQQEASETPSDHPIYLQEFPRSIAKLQQYWYCVADVRKGSTAVTALEGIGLQDPCYV